MSWCFKSRSKKSPLAEKNGGGEGSPDKNPNKVEDEGENLQAVLKRDENGRTVVHEAAANGDVKAIRAYKNKGLDLNIPDNDGVTPAHVAAENNRWNVLEVLHFLDANLNVKDVCHQTPAHYGAWHGYKDVLKTLNKFNIPLNVTDEDQKTPAHYASRQGHCGVLKALYQINPQLFLAKDNDGKSPLYYATGQAAEMFYVRGSQSDRRLDFQGRVPTGTTNGSYGSPRAGEVRSRAGSTGRMKRSSKKSDEDIIGRSPSMRSDSRGYTTPRGESTYLRPAPPAARNSAKSDEDHRVDTSTPRSDITHLRPPVRRYDNGFESPRRVSPRRQRYDDPGMNIGTNTYRSLPPLKEQEQYNSDLDERSGRERRIDFRAGSVPRRRREQEGRSTTPLGYGHGHSQLMRTPTNGSSRSMGSPRARERERG